MVQCATTTNDVQAIQNCPPTESSRFSERLRFRINTGPAIQITDQRSRATQDNHRFMEDRIIRIAPGTMRTYASSKQSAGRAFCTKSVHDPDIHISGIW